LWALYIRLKDVHYRLLIFTHGRLSLLSKEQKEQAELKERLLAIVTRVLNRIHSRSGTVHFHKLAYLSR